jgi:hypothetical protein
VETGVVKAAGSGSPIAVDEQQLKLPPPAERPAPPRLDAPWLRVSETQGPVRLFFASPRVRFVLIVAFILLAVLGLGRFIESRRPGNHPERWSR